MQQLWAHPVGTEAQYHEDLFRRVLVQRPELATCYRWSRCILAPEKLYRAATGITSTSLASVIRFVCLHTLHLSAYPSQMRGLDTESPRKKREEKRAGSCFCKSSSSGVKVAVPCAFFFCCSFHTYCLSKTLVEKHAYLSFRFRQRNALEGPIRCAQEQPMRTLQAVQPLAWRLWFNLNTHNIAAAGVAGGKIRV